MFEALLGMGQDALMEMLKSQAAQAMGPELAAMGGAGAVGGLLGQTQTGMAAAPEVAAATAPAAEAPGMLDTLKTNVMSDINKSPYGQAYNTVMNPNATASDYTSMGYKIAFSPEMEKQNQMGMSQMPGMPMSGGGRVTTTGGIPDLLKRYGGNPGLLQYLG